MENLTNNPGLQHIAEDIFLNLTSDSIEKCQEVDESWKSMLKDPLFWLKKCIKNGHLKKTKSAWEKAVQITRGTNMEECVMEHLKIISDSESTCLIGLFSRYGPVGITPIFAAAQGGHANVIQVLLPFTDNPNAPGPDGRTAIFAAAQGGHANVIQVFAPLTDNPNAPGPNRSTPMQEALLRNFHEVVRILQPYI